MSSRPEFRLIVNDGEVEPSFRSEHDLRWDSLTAIDAPYVRGALLKAQEIRETVPGQTGIDAGRIYLEAFAARRAS